MGHFTLEMNTKEAKELRDEVPWAVTEKHEHSQELLGLFSVIVQTLHEEFEASLRTELTDEGPKFGQKVVEMGQTCGEGTATDMMSFPWMPPEHCMSAWYKKLWYWPVSIWSRICVSVDKAVW